VVAMTSKFPIPPGRGEGKKFKLFHTYKRRFLERNSRMVHTFVKNKLLFIPIYSGLLDFGIMQLSFDPVF
jgi:hypothetical protein